MSLQLFDHGLLSQIWLFSHSLTRINRLQIANFPIIDGILALKKEKTVVALRISAQLLIGVVKIYENQVKIVLEETSEALQSIGKVAEPVILQHNVKLTIKTKKNVEQMVLRTAEKATFLPFLYERLPVLVATHEEITLNEPEIPKNEGKNGYLKEHIEVSETFLDDLIDEEFRIDPILPEIPQILPEISPNLPEISANLPKIPANFHEIPSNLPQKVPENDRKSITSREIEEDENEFLNLDEIINETSINPQKKRKNKRETEKNRRKIEEDEVILPESDPQEATILPVSTANESIPVPENPIFAISSAESVLEKPKKPRGFRSFRSKFISETTEIDYESIAHMDMTGDIVRPTAFAVERPALSSSAVDKVLLHGTLVSGMTKELNDFFDSNHPILIIKNRLRDELEQEITQKTQENPPEIPLKTSENPIQPPETQVKPPEIPEIPVIPLASEAIIPIIKLEPCEPPSTSSEKLSERSIKMLQLIEYRLKGRKSLFFSELSEGRCAKTRACGFFELLVLVRRRLIGMKQEEKTGDLEICLGSRM